MSSSWMQSCIKCMLLAFLALPNHISHGALAPITSFVQTSGSQFSLNGSPFLFNGFNSYWMMHVAANPADRYKVSNVFRDAAAAGLSVCRTWAFSDGGDQALQISPGVYDENVFQALDFVVSEAKKNGVRLILSFVNNYNDFGGRPQYVSWARSAGAPVSTDDDFYTHPVTKSYYKNHVQRVMTRVNTITGTAYKDEPTIMAWELMNEPRCQADYSGNTVNGWVQEMATYVKSIDRKQLLEVGMEGFYGDSLQDRKQYNPGYQVGTDFISNNLVPEIDFATIHAYPDAWLSGQSDYSQTEFLQRWMAMHSSDSRSILKKPLVFTEFGKSSKDPGYSISSRDEFLSGVYASILSLARNEGSFAGGLVWQILAEGMDSYDDGYQIVLSEDGSTSSLIDQQSNKMIALEHHLMSRRHLQLKNRFKNELNN
uniref:mannan endo-1,4-beta-mannosidase n=1 Tax=Kalanchoe fedtschenkoi TaxID=63787 RepID=A0A7N0U9L9_KALFE